MDYKRVIIVDDNETALFLNTDVVEEYFDEIEVLTYSNSQEFIDGCFNNTQWLTEHTLVLLDINMPGKYGFDVLEELEEEFEDMKNMSFAMVTSSTLKRDRECSERYPSMIGYIVKPLEVESLSRILEGGEMLLFK